MKLATLDYSFPFKLNYNTSIIHALLITINDV